MLVTITTVHGSTATGDDCKIVELFLISKFAAQCSNVEASVPNKAVPESCIF